MIKRILVPTDGSKNADKALTYALDLAKKYEATVEVLTVLQYPLKPVSEVNSEYGRKASYSVDLVASYENVLSKASKKAKNIASQVKVSTQLVKGQPAYEIVNRAKEGNFDLIVMGCRGLSTIKRLVLGSVSNKVVNDAECQVLIVK